MSENEAWYCGNCGGESIHHDAIVSWNSKSQKWVVESVLDDSWCHDCMESADGSGSSGEEDRGDPQWGLVQQARYYEVVLPPLNGQPRSIVVKAHCLNQAMRARSDAVRAEWLGDDGVPDEIDVDLIASQ